MKITVTIKNLQKKIPVYPKRIKKAILKTLKSEGVNSGQISISFVGDKLIAKLNSRYLKKNNPTDVLAFDLGPKKKSESYPINGDIIVSAETAEANSRIYQTGIAYELELYAIHGLLHLLGYADHKPKDKTIMRKKELTYVHP